MPSASPRSSSPNQAITARPLAALTPAPSAPATDSAATRCVKEDEYAAHTSAAAVPSWPIAMTERSPIRSATIPQRSSVASEPMLSAASTTPTCVRLSA
jgi:hypothetical protein